MTMNTHKKYISTIGETKQIYRKLTIAFVIHVIVKVYCDRFRHFEIFLISNVADIIAEIHSHRGFIGLCQCHKQKCWPSYTTCSVYYVTGLCSSNRHQS